jgi:hypothetical protein
MESDRVKAAVRERYGEVAKGEATCGSLCGCTDNAEGLAMRGDRTCIATEGATVSAPIIRS